MEQEELSDSDEEMEDVEFEREEMADSDDKEGSDTDQVVNTHKEVMLFFIPGILVLYVQSCHCLSSLLYKYLLFYSLLGC